MLILLKQTPTGLFAADSSGQSSEIYEQLWFNTVSLALETKELLDAPNARPFEMVDGQLIHTASGVEYRYDGSGGFTTSSPPVTPVFTLSISASPAAGGTVADLTNTAPYEEGESVSLSATVATGFTFIGWMRNGLTLSTSLAYTYIMPPANTVLQAIFLANADIPTPPTPPAPIPISTLFYDLEIRIGATQIAIQALVPQSNTGIFSDEFSGDYSFPITIPLDPPLMAALGFPNDPQSSWDYTEPFPCELWKSGNRLGSGFLDVLKADENAIRCSLLLDSAFFISQYKNTSIRSCYTDADVISIADQTSFAVGGYQIQFMFKYTVRATINSTSRIFIKSEYEDHILMLEAVADWIESLPLGLEVSIEYSDDLTDYTSKIIYWDTTVVTTATIEEFRVLATGGQWTSNRNSKPNKLTSRRLQMEPWNQVNERNRIAFPTVYNRELYDGNNPLHDGIVNRYDTLGRLYYSNNWFTNFSESFRWQHALVPYVYLTDVVQTVFRALNITVTGEFFESDLVKRMLLYNNRTLDYLQIKTQSTVVRRTPDNVTIGNQIRPGTEGRPSASVDPVPNTGRRPLPDSLNAPEEITTRYENVHDFNILLRNHVPDYSVIDFLKGLKNYFGLKYDFNILQNRVEIRFVRSIIAQRTVLDLTAKASRLFTLEHSKETGIAFAYDSPDPLMQDGSSPTPQGAAGDFQVNNFLALNSLDAELLQVAFVRSLRAYFTLTSDQDNPPFWKLTSFLQQDDPPTNPPPGGQGGGGGRVGSRKPWTLTLYPLIDAFVYGKKMPAIECTAEQPEVNLNNKESGLRIMAFYGTQTDGANRPYSFASCTRYNAKEIESAAQYDLDIRSADLTPYWKDLEGMIRAAKIQECTLLLDDTDLVALSKTPKVKIANIDYLIDTQEMRISADTKSLSKVKFYKVK